MEFELTMTNTEQKNHILNLKQINSSKSHFLIQTLVVNKNSRLIVKKKYFQSEFHEILYFGGFFHQNLRN